MDMLRYKEARRRGKRLCTSRRGAALKREEGLACVFIPSDREKETYQERKEERTVDKTERSGLSLLSFAFETLATVAIVRLEIRLVKLVSSCIATLQSTNFCLCGFEILLRLAKLKFHELDVKRGSF